MTLTEAMEALKPDVALMDAAKRCTQGEVRTIPTGSEGQRFAAAYYKQQEAAQAILDFLKPLLKGVYYCQDEWCSSDLMEFADNADADSVISVTQCYCGEPLWIATFNDKDGCTEYETFDTKEEAEAFLNTRAANQSEGV